MNDRLKRIISNPGILFLGLGGRGFFKWMNDRTYLRIAYRLNLHAENAAQIQRVVITEEDIAVETS